MNNSLYLIYNSILRQYDRDQIEYMLIFCHQNVNKIFFKDSQQITRNCGKFSMFGGDCNKSNL